jgi:hypothetical protein
MAGTLENLRVFSLRCRFLPAEDPRQKCTMRIYKFLAARQKRGSPYIKAQPVGDL